MPPGDELVGGTLDNGKYHIQSVLGAGAMGKVYAALHTGLKRRVAIKVLHPEVASDETFVARLRREARATARLQHRNTVQVLDFGESDGRVYIVMEFLEGTTLFVRLKRAAPLSVDQAVPILMETLAALGAAHEHAIIHRDIKPENIMLVPRRGDDGEAHEIVKVCDFGIAKQVEKAETERIDDGPTLTEVGHVFGTPPYMSPEQVRAQPVDARSDLYGCGILLYQMLVGRLPFKGDSPVSTMLMHVLDPVPSLEQHAPDVPPALAEVIYKALAKAPDDRFESATAMRAAIRAAVGGATAPTLGHPAPPVLPRQGTTAMATAETLTQDTPRISLSAAGTSNASPTRLGGRVSRRVWQFAALALLTAAGIWWVQSGALDPSPPPDGPTAVPSAAPANTRARVVASAAPRQRSKPASPAPTALAPGSERPGQPVPAVVAETALSSPSSAPTPSVEAPPLVPTPHVSRGPTSAMARPARPLAVAVVASPTALTPTPSKRPTPARVRSSRPRPKAAKPSPIHKPSAPAPQLKPAPAASQAAVDPLTPENGGAKPEPVVAPAPVAPPSLPTQAVVVAKAPEDPAPKPKTYALAAAVRTSGLSVAGSLPRSAVTRAIARLTAKLKSCYKTAAVAAGIDKAGTTEVALVIDEDGHARNVSATGGPFPKVSGCVAGVVKRLRSRTRPDTGVVRVRFSIRFVPH